MGKSSLSGTSSNTSWPFSSDAARAESSLKVAYGLLPLLAIRVVAGARKGFVGVDRDTRSLPSYWCKGRHGVTAASRRPKPRGPMLRLAITCSDVTARRPLGLFRSILAPLATAGT